MLSSRPYTDGPGPSMHQQMPFKTPAKASTSNAANLHTIMRTNLKENTTNHATLLKSAKAPSGFPMTPGFKKSVAGTPAFNIFKETNLLGTASKNTTKMPRLLDMTNKTPFMNSTIPGSPTFESPLKAPFQLTSADAPETVLRPSRARTSLRKPRISGGSANGGGGLPPVTPAPEGRGKHWEVLSPGDVSIEEEEAVEVDEAPSIPLDAEVEYMPPPVVELPYDPGFDMPDYREIGASIWKIGNIIDMRNLVCSRPPERPVEIFPENIVSNVDQLFPMPPPECAPPDLDLTRFIGSKNLYDHWQKPASTSPKATTPASSSPSPSSALPKPVPQSSSTRAPVTRTRSRSGTTTTTSKTVPPTTTSVKKAPVPAPTVRKGTSATAVSRTHSRAQSTATTTITRANSVIGSASARPGLSRAATVAAAASRAGSRAASTATAPAPAKKAAAARPVVNSGARAPAGRTTTASTSSSVRGGVRAAPAALAALVARVEEEDLLEEELMMPVAMDGLGLDFDIGELKLLSSEEA